MASNEERRRWPRLPHQEQLITKVISSSDPTISAGRTFMSKTSDISRQGLRIHLPTEVPSDTRLELWVISIKRKGTLVLTGDVRWCRPEEEGKGFVAGVEFSHRPTNDGLAWQQMVADILSETSPQQLPPEG